MIPSRREKTTFAEIPIGTFFYRGEERYIKRSETTADRCDETIALEEEVEFERHYWGTPEDLDRLGVPRSHTVISPGFANKSKPSPKPETNE
jgi:hypothetical protein